MRRGLAHWKARNNGNRVGFLEGRKLDTCWTYKFVFDRSIVTLGAASVLFTARAATNLPLLVAAEQFLLSNEWSCFLPCWNTTLLWEPRKYKELLVYNYIDTRTILCLDRLKCSAVLLVRERDFLRGLTLVYIATVYTHTLSDILYWKQVFDQCFSAAFVHYCWGQMVRSRMNLAAASPKWSRVPFNARVASLFCPPLAAPGGGQPVNRDGTSQTAVGVWRVSITSSLVDFYY